MDTKNFLMLLKKLKFSQFSLPSELLSMVQLPLQSQMSPARQGLLLSTLQHRHMEATLYLGLVGVW